MYSFCEIKKTGIIIKISQKTTAICGSSCTKREREEEIVPASPSSNTALCVTVIIPGIPFCGGRTATSTLAFQDNEPCLRPETGNILGRCSLFDSHRTQLANFSISKLDDRFKVAVGSIFPIEGDVGPSFS